MPDSPTRSGPSHATPRTQRSLTVLLPVLNEAESLPELYRRLPPILDGLTSDWRILFVDDGSTDDTLSIIRTFASQDPRFTALSFSRNFGKEIAIAAGLQSIDTDAAIIMDADLQHPPDVLAAFVDRWLEGYDVVYGQRIDRRQESAIRRTLARLFYRTYNALVDTDIPEGAGDFRLLARNAIDALNAIRETSRFNKGLYSWIGFRSVGVPFTVEQRSFGTSKWRFAKLWSFAIDGITSFTTLPLRVWSLLGVIISGISMAYATIILINTLVHGIDVPGYASLITSVMFLSGVQLISLGVLGQYVGRVYEEVKDRPLYIVAEAIGVTHMPTAARHTPQPPAGLFTETQPACESRPATRAPSSDQAPHDRPVGK